MVRCACGRSFVSIQFALASFYADCPHKHILKVNDIEKNNVQVELIRFRKNYDC